MLRNVFLILAILCWISASWAASPSLRSGDMVFQTSNSHQSYAIMWATKSLYSHVGIVEVDKDKVFVIEAIAKVTRTPFEKWKARGRFGRYAVYRYENLSEEQEKSIVNAAKGLIGRRYNLFFTLKSDAIYCSELVELAFNKVGISIGKMQKVRELDVDNFVVKKLAHSRWRAHPACLYTSKFDECWKKILEDDVITPMGLLSDDRVKMIYSNYP